MILQQNGSKHLNIFFKEHVAPKYFFYEHVTHVPTKWMTLFYINAHFDLASAKSGHSPNWRLQNLYEYGEYEIKVTRHLGENWRV